MTGSYGFSMADNIQTPFPALTPFASDEGAHSGDTVHFQPVTLYLVAGAEGAKTMTPIVMPAALGTNNGLKVDIVGDTGTASVLDTDNLAGVTLNTKSMLNGSTTLVPKFAAIAVSASGNNTLVAAVTSKKIRVLAYNFIANGSVNAKFQSGASGTDLTGLKYCVANGGLVAPFNPLGWFETAAGVLLNLNLSGAVPVGGELVYVEI
jgi:hypothetical protein